MTEEQAILVIKQMYKYLYDKINFARISGDSVMEKFYTQVFHDFVDIEREVVGE